LSRRTGLPEVVIGVPVAGRVRPELEGLVGCFVNLLPVRVAVDGESSFRRLLGAVRERALEAFEHQEIPFERLVEALRPERSPGRHPLFQVACNVLNYPEPRLDLPGVEAEVLPRRDLPGAFDMTLYAAERGGDMELELLYDATRYS